MLQILVRTMVYASAALNRTLASVSQDTVASIANSTSMIARPHHVRMAAPVWTVYVLTVASARRVILELTVSMLLIGA